MLIRMSDRSRCCMYCASVSTGGAPMADAPGSATGKAMFCNVVKAPGTWPQRCSSASCHAGNSSCGLAPSRKLSGVVHTKPHTVPEGTGHWPSLDAPWPGLGTESRPAGQDWTGTGTECLGWRTDSSRTQSPVPIENLINPLKSPVLGGSGGEKSPICTTIFGNPMKSGSNTHWQPQLSGGGPIIRHSTFADPNIERF